MTPTFCESVLECVTQQINDTYEVFQQVHPDFVSSGGKVTLAGHSLGSVIVWDLLTILKDFNNQEDIICSTADEVKDNFLAPISPILVDSNIDVDSKVSSSNMNAVGVESETLIPKFVFKNASHHHHGTWGPSLSKQIKRALQFHPECTILLGSPLGMFLSLRGAHGAFDEMRIKARNENTILSGDKQRTSSSKVGVKNEKSRLIENDGTSSDHPTVSPFFLPTNKFFNIFHPRYVNPLTL
jgi:DDHD domain